MLLLRLKEYSDQRLQLPPPLYNEAPVRYVLDLDKKGHLLNPQPMDTANPEDRRTRRGERRPVPQIQRTVKIKPLLLADTAEYTLGLPRESSRPERVQTCHQAYLDLLDRCAAMTGESAVEAVRTFLHSDPVAQLDLPEDFDRGATITFRVDGVFLVDLPAVQAFWAAENDPAPGSAPIMQCLICGQERPVLDRLQAKIKGIPGGQPSGTAIISANAPAFESYGLEASLIAPTCADCGERFTKAANELLANDTSRIVLGNAVFIFWTREKIDFDFRTFMTDPKPDQVLSLLASVRTGKWTPKVDETAFFAAALSASGGRAVVRDWIDTTIGEVKRHLTRWFQWQWIVDAFGDEPRPLGLYALAATTVRDPAKELAPPTPRALLRAALTGTPLPSSLLYQAVRRNRAEQTVTRPRAALIKLVLLSQHPDFKEETMVQLDPDNLNPAYRCGRLLAVLEDVQRLAIGKATIVDRFFGTASSAPASVFGRLLRGAQPHLAKLERDQPRAYHALQKRLEEIQAGLASFPRTLTLEEQGMFALGYYHQHAFDRAQAREAAERRKAASVPATDETDTNEEE